MSDSLSTDLLLPESLWITERCATTEHVIKTAECPWCSIACQQEEIAKLRYALGVIAHGCEISDPQDYAQQALETI